MGSARAPSPEQLAALRAAFAARPPSRARDFRAAAQVAKCDEAMARRAWNRGWSPAVPSIAVALAEERALAASSAEVLKAERLADDVLASAADLHAKITRLAPVVDAVVEGLTSTTVDLAAVVRAKPMVGLLVLDKIGRVVKNFAALSARAIEVRRLVDGDPTSIVRVEHDEIGAPIDVNEARAELAAAQRALDRMARHALPPAPSDEDDDIADEVPSPAGGPSGSVN